MKPKRLSSLKIPPYRLKCNMNIYIYIAVNLLEDTALAGYEM